MKKGKFITFEGIDGVGKTSQISMVASYLKEKGKEVIATREPGGTLEAEKIRDLILSNHFTKYTDILLFTAARIEHYNVLIKPSLESGKIVICDRFIDSTLAYQSIHQDFIIDLHNKYVDGIMPDVTFLMIADVDLCIERIKTRSEDKNKYDSASASVMKEVQDRFLELADKYKERFVIIDASLEKDAIFNQIIQKLEGL